MKLLLVVVILLHGGLCKEQKENCEQLPGAFCPQCDSQQCSSSTGYCWCGNTETLLGTKPVNSGGVCKKQQKNCKPIPGAFCPQCDSKGNFLPQQCSGSTGYCWCVNPITGIPINGTETPPGTPRVNCGGLCKKQQNSCKPLIGAFCPQCDSKGNFLPQQCWASTGYCWCVNTITGNKINGTETPPGTPRVNCGGVCEKQQNSCKPLIGAFCPQCDSKGNFLPQQCWPSTGYCWCVNTITGNEINGTGTPPGTPRVNCGS